MLNFSKSARCCSGLTLLELLFALAIVAVIAMAGTAGLQHAVLNLERRAAVNGLISIIQLARGIAQSGGTTLVLCQVNDEARCAGTGRQWHLAANESAKPLRVLASDYAGLAVSNRSSFEFRPFPLRSTNGTISFCDPRGGTHERAIVISYSGRPRIVRPESENGVMGCQPE